MVELLGQIGVAGRHRRHLFRGGGSEAGSSRLGADEGAGGGDVFCGVDGDHVGYGPLLGLHKKAPWESAARPCSRRLPRSRCVRAKGLVPGGEERKGGRKSQGAKVKENLRSHSQSPSSG